MSDDERRIAAAEYRRWLRRFEQSIRRSLQEHPGVRDANATLEIGHVVRDGRRDREVLWHLWIDPESRQEFEGPEVVDMAEDAVRDAGLPVIATYEPFLSHGSWKLSGVAEAW